VYPSFRIETDDIGKSTASVNREIPLFFVAVHVRDLSESTPVSIGIFLNGTSIHVQRTMITSLIGTRNLHVRGVHSGFFPPSPRTQAARDSV
jgi:hypothetical protein